MKNLFIILLNVCLFSCNPNTVGIPDKNKNEIFQEITKTQTFLWVGENHLLRNLTEDYVTNYIKGLPPGKIGLFIESPDVTPKDGVSITMFGREITYFSNDLETELHVYVRFPNLIMDYYKILGRIGPTLLPSIIDGLDDYTKVDYLKSFNDQVLNKNDLTLQRLLSAEDTVILSKVNQYFREWEISVVKSLDQDEFNHIIVVSGTGHSFIARELSKKRKSHFKLIQDDEVDAQRVIFLNWIMDKYI